MGRAHALAGHIARAHEMGCAVATWAAGHISWSEPLLSPRAAGAHHRSGAAAAGKAAGRTAGRWAPEGRRAVAARLARPMRLLVAHSGGQDGEGELAAHGGAGGEKGKVFRFLAEEAGLGAARAATALTKYPPLLKKSVEGDLTPTLKILVEEVGLGKNKEGAAKAIAYWPTVLGLNVENNLRPVVWYLAEELGLGKDGAANVIPSSPRCWA